MPDAFTHGPHCVPQEDYARLMAAQQRALAANKALAEQLRAEQETCRVLWDLLREAMQS